MYHQPHLPPSKGGSVANEAGGMGCSIATRPLAVRCRQTFPPLVDPCPSKNITISVERERNSLFDGNDRNPQDYVVIVFFGVRILQKEEIISLNVIRLSCPLAIFRNNPTGYMEALPFSHKI